MEIKIGQVWKIKEDSKRHWFENIITISRVEYGQFSFKEDTHNQSWPFSLLIDNYNLTDKE